jgi:NitT/TauT family transport system permease protein
VAVSAVLYLNAHLGFSHFPSLMGLGFVTFARVVVLLVVSTIIWVPVGVKIGMSPRLSRFAQPIVQVLASFPAILLFPFITAIFLGLGVPLDYGANLLMMLGAQLACSRLVGADGLVSCRLGLLWRPCLGT